MRLQTLFASGALAAAACVFAAPQADAAIIHISTHSSEAGIDPSELSASFEFTVSGNTLTLTVTNNTSSPNDYLINELYFNAAASVGTLTQTSGNTGWTFMNNQAADGFGVFQYALIDGVGAGSPAIAPGASLTWEFSFTGTATGFDFVSVLSSVPPGDTPSIVAAKFMVGPGDDSVYGATNVIPPQVPAPGAALLLAGLFAGRRRRR